MNKTKVSHALTHTPGVIIILFSRKDSLRNTFEKLFLDAQVTESVVYRFSASKLYPVISSYADPALDRITHSPYYSAVVDHLKPTCANSQLSKSASLDSLPCIQC